MLRNQTQESLARELEVSVRALRKVESGEPVNASTLLSVVRALGYEKDFLSILAQPKPVTIEQHQALAHGAKPRRRASAMRKGKAKTPTLLRVYGQADGNDVFLGTVSYDARHRSSAFQ